MLLSVFVLCSAYTVLQRKLRLVGKMCTIGHENVERLRSLRGVCRSEAWGAYVGAWVGGRAVLFCAPLSCFCFLLRLRRDETAQNEKSAVVCVVERHDRQQRSSAFGAFLFCWE